MSKEAIRIGVRCSKCDHPIVTLPEDYHVAGLLTCPGCGETFELPDNAESLLGEMEEGLGRTTKASDGAN